MESGVTTAGPRDFTMGSLKIKVVIGWWEAKGEGVPGQQLCKCIHHDGKAPSEVNEKPL